MPRLNDVSVTIDVDLNLNTEAFAEKVADEVVRLMRDQNRRVSRFGIKPAADYHVQSKRRRRWRQVFEAEPFLEGFSWKIGPGWIRLALIGDGRMLRVHLPLPRRPFRVPLLEFITLNERPHYMDISADGTRLEDEVSGRSDADRA